jgi:amidase
MTFEEYVQYDGLGLAALVKSGQVSRAEVLEAAIAAIEARNGAVNAVVHAAYDEARATPAVDGPFAGVPFLIKDLALKVQGWPRSSGSKFAQVPSDLTDDVLTTRYREAGLVLVGKTNTPEFGITGTTESARLGPCRNPWNTDHIAGGSSGGSASAVAAGMVPVAHASDGLGSIRIPAACCGLVGMKPTRDRNPNGQDDFDRAVGNVVDHVVSRTVRDNAAMLDATGYPEPDAPHAPAPKAGPYLDEVGRAPGRLRIAWSAQRPFPGPVDPQVAAAIAATAETLTALGHEVIEEPLAIDYERLWSANRAYAAASFAVIFERWVEMIGRRPEPHELEPLTWAALEGGKAGTAMDAMRGWQDFRMVCRDIQRLFLGIDVYLSPVLAEPPPKIGEMDPVALSPAQVAARQGEVFPYAWPFNFTGQPSISLPLAQSAEGLPIGLMFTGRYGDEATLFRLAGQLEREMPWNTRRPALWN